MKVIVFSIIIHLRMKKYYLLILVLLTSCHPKSRSITNEMFVDSSSDTSCIVFEIKNNNLKNMEILDNLDEIVDKVEYIPLETNSSSLIGLISMMRFYKGKFYILDSHISKAIFIFNEDGTHFKTIANVGRGPTEYISPHYISIDPFNDEFILYDRNDDNLLYYDLDGNFIRKENVGIRLSNIVRITKEDFLIYFTTNVYNNPKVENHAVAIGVPPDSIKYVGLYKDEFYRNLYAYSQNIHVFGEKYFITSPFRNEIYQILPDGKMFLRYRFEFEYGNQDIYRSIDNSEIEAFFNEIYARRIGFYYGSQFLDTERYLITSVSFGSDLHELIYDKKTRKTRMSKEIYENGKLISMGLTPACADGKTYYTTSPVSYILFQKGEREKKGYNFPESLKGITEEDNPVIVKFTLHGE